MPPSFAKFLGWVSAALTALALLTGLSSTAGDIVLYAYYADQAWHGRHFFTNMPIEYPPLNALLFMVPQMLTVVLPHTSYYGIFLALGAVTDVLQKRAIAALGGTWRQAVQIALLAAACTAVLGYTYLKRFDVFAAALTTWMLVRMSRRPDDLWAWVLYAMATACKLYPGTLAPLLLGYSYHQKVPRRRIVAQVGVGLGVLVAIHAAATLYGGVGAWSWVAYMRDRGLQLASVYTAIGIVWDHWGRPVPTFFAFGCVQVRTAWSDFCVASSPWFTAGLMAVTWWRTWVLRGTVVGLWRASLACVVALLITSKVLSPQYVIWLVPLLSVAAVVPRPDWLLTVLALLLCLTTAGLFPYELEIAEGKVLRQGVLVLRSAILVAIWTWICFGRRRLHALPDV